jgi:hypothetical protein
MATANQIEFIELGDATGTTKSGTSGALWDTGLIPPFLHKIA